MSEKAEKAELEKRAIDLEAVLKTPQGRDAIWEILSLCGIYDNQFTGNSGTFYNEGRRSVGLDIIDMMGTADPTVYPRLMLERAKLEDHNG